MIEELKRSLQLFENVGYETILTEKKVIINNPLNQRRAVIYLKERNLIEIVAYNNNVELQRKKLDFHQKRFENIVDYIL